MLELGLKSQAAFEQQREVGRQGAVSKEEHFGEKVSRLIWLDTGVSMEAGGPRKAGRGRAGGAGLPGGGCGLHLQGRSTTAGFSFKKGSHSSSHVCRNYTRG